MAGVSSRELEVSVWDQRVNRSYVARCHDFHIFSCHSNQARVNQGNTPLVDNHLNAINVPSSSPTIPLPLTVKPRFIQQLSVFQILSSTTYSPRNCTSHQRHYSFVVQTSCRRIDVTIPGLSTWWRRCMRIAYASATTLGIMQAAFNSKPTHLTNLTAREGNRQDCADGSWVADMREVTFGGATDRSSYQTNDADLIAGSNYINW